MTSHRWLLAALCCAWGCDSAEGLEIVVDLRTDYAPGVEIVRVETTLTAGASSEPRTVSTVVDATTDLVAGHRVAELGGLARGSHRIDVALRALDGSLVGRRSRTLELADDTGVTIVVTRDCAGGSCPGSADPPGATECQNGACCAASDAVCGVACTTDGECGIPAGCGGARCADGACLGLDCGVTVDGGTGDTAVPDATPCTVGLPCDWAAAGWSHRTDIDIDNSTRSIDLVAFPLLVRLTSPERFDRSAAQPDGDDLRFVDSTDTSNVLPHEIEAWDVDGEAVVWVQLPTVAAGTRHTISLYYGNPEAASAERATDVWGDDYLGVWHLGDATASNQRDSSGNGGTARNVGPVDAEGYIGRGRALDGLDDYLEVPDAPGLRSFGSTVTLSGWVFVRSLSEDRPVSWPWPQVVMTRQNETMRGSGDFVLGFDSSPPLAYSRAIFQTDEILEVRGRTRAIGEWTYLAAVYDGTESLIYQDGIRDGTMPLSGDIQQSANPILFGADNNNSSAPNSDFIDAVLDELRIESVARSAEWIEAQHTSMTDVLASYTLVSPP